MVRSLLQIESSQIPLEIRLAKTPEEVGKACRLRYEVFVEEEGANLVNTDSIEQDEFDRYCDHLLVLRTDTQEVVGTYRLLPGERALRGIGFYSESEFDLTQYRPLFHDTVELGRSCVKKEYRTGKAISLLWEGIGRYVLEKNIKYLIGCASIPAGSGPKINEIYTYLKTNHVFNGMVVRPRPEFQIDTLCELDTTATSKELFRCLPPLIKGYLRLGAYICGEPAYDPFFRTFDFFMVLDRNHLVKRYQDNFLKAI